jgi:hypothetical protein
MGFWGQWCQFVEEVVVGGRNGCVVEVVGVVGEGFGYALVVVEVVDEGSDRAEPRAYALADEEYQWCTTSPRALPTPY